MNNHHNYEYNLDNCEIKAPKKSGLNGIRTQELCDSGDVTSPVISSDLTIKPTGINYDHILNA